MALGGFSPSIGENMKLEHGRQLALVVWQREGELDARPLIGVSEWVLQKIGEVRKDMGLSFNGLESEAWAMFVELEK